MFNPRSELLPPPGFQQPYPSAEWPLPAQSPVYLQPPPGFQPLRDPYVAPQLQRYPYHLIRLNQQPPQGHRPVQSWFRQSIPGYAYHLITTPSATGHQTRRPAYMDAPINMFTGPVVLPVAKVALKEFGTVTAVAESHEQSSEDVCDDETVSPIEATEKASNLDAESIFASSEQVQSPMQTACVMEKQEQSPRHTNAMKKVSDSDVDENTASSEQVPSSSQKTNVSTSEEQPSADSRSPNAESLKTPSILQLPESALALATPRAHQEKKKLHRDQHQRVQLGGELPPWLSLVLCCVISVTMFSLWFRDKNLIDINHCVHFAICEIMFIVSICLSYVYYDLLHAKFLILCQIIWYLGIGGPGNFCFYIMDVMLYSNSMYTVFASVI